MNNPFDYEPSAAMLEAQKRLVVYIESLCNANPAFMEEVSKGKMFGILRTSPNPSQGGEIINTKDSGQLTISSPWGRTGGVGLDGGLLYAFSGQICGSFYWPQFVSPVFDYLDEDGYFKVHEREISAINHHIADLESSEELASLRQEYAQLKTESEENIEDYRRKMKAAKLERDLIRGKGLTDEASLIRESQFMKAEMHRKKLFWKERLDAVSSKINSFVGNLNLKKLQRQQKSDALQRWLFEQFIFTNPHTSEKKNLLEIFEKYYLDHSVSLPHGRVGEGLSFLPPSGSGECCEPKLLHYAFEHNLEPIEIGMFWWGESPKQEVRHHLQFYPACNGKCKPVLKYMLGEGPTPATPPNLPQGEETINTPDSGQLKSSPLWGDKRGVVEVFVDNFIIIVNKPPFMLSVPGRSSKPSVYSILKEKYPDCAELQMVHRLDMDTSGLLVVTKTKEVHKNLQRQFAEHTIRKEYAAILEKPLKQEKGTISLPLRPDYDDRPRQIVDKINGKEAITEYFLKENRENNGEIVVKLVPLTGRTHQLRVHCAHKEGLDNPIKGDRLYGKKADRLYLHAEYLEFTHPITGERMHFRIAPDWEITENDSKN